MAKKSTAERARDLTVRFKRIKAAVMVTDQLLDGYFDRRATEIEAFNGELQTMVTTEDEATQPN